MDEELLTQPAAVSEFTKEVTANIWGDVSPFEVEQLLQTLSLEDNEANPTELAKRCGLPGNDKLVALIGQAADAHQAMTINQNQLLITSALLAKCEPHTPTYDKLLYARQWNEKNVKDYGDRYAQAFLDAYAMTDKY